jgi:hypothetical protein
MSEDENRESWDVEMSEDDIAFKAWHSAEFGSYVPWRDVRVVARMADAWQAACVHQRAKDLKAVKEVSTYSTASDSAYALGLADACKAIAARINNTEG